MTCKTVNTQADLDAALAVADDACIHIDSAAGVWLRLNGNNGHRLEARGSSSVVARGSSSVVARGSSSVVAWDSSSVEAWGSSSVVAWDSSSVVARDSSSVVAWGSSSVVAWDSSSVEAWDSSSVVARGSSSVVARGATRVSARDHSTTRATSHVAVHLHSGQAVVEGGVLIDITAIDMDDPAVWCEHHGVRVADGLAQLYKAADGELTAGRGYSRPTVYAVGTEVSAPDWRADPTCGGGLHLSPHPRQAYRYAAVTEPRYLLVEAAVAGLVPLGEDKCKVQSCRVVAEVDIRGRVLAAVAEEA